MCTPECISYVYIYIHLYVNICMYISVCIQMPRNLSNKQISAPHGAGQKNQICTPCQKRLQTATSIYDFKAFWSGATDGSFSNLLLTFELLGDTSVCTRLYVYICMYECICQDGQDTGHKTGRVKLNQ